MPNAMLEQRRAHLEQGYEIGQFLWRQLTADIISEILYDDSVMDDKVLDPALILKINSVLEERSNYYKGALGIEPDDEADIKRSKLDYNMKALVDAYNEARPEGEPELPFMCFEERMPVTQITYDKPIRNNNRHPAARRTGKRRKH